MFNIAQGKCWIRQGVLVKRTSILEDEGGFGVYAPPEGFPRPGMFVGTYIGLSWRQVGIFAAPYRGRDDYVMESGCWRWTPTCVGQKPDLGMFPMAAMQEPPKGARANCTFKTFRQPTAVGLSGSRPVTGRES